MRSSELFGHSSPMATSYSAVTIPVTPGICRMYSRGIGSSGPNQRKVICIGSRGSHDEVVDGARPVLRTRSQDGRGKAWLVGRIGEMLRLERKPGTIPQRDTAFAGDGAVEKVAGIALDARLGRMDVQP